MAQCMLCEVTATLNVLSALKQRGKLSLKHLRRWRKSAELSWFFFFSNASNLKRIRSLTFCLVLQMFSTSVMRAVLRWCRAFSSSSKVLLISVTESFFLSVSCLEISFTRSMAAVNWGSLPEQKTNADYSSLYFYTSNFTNVFQKQSHNILCVKAVKILPVANSVQLTFKGWLMLFEHIP